MFDLGSNHQKDKEVLVWGRGGVMHNNMIELLVTANRECMELHSSNAQFESPFCSLHTRLTINGNPRLSSDLPPP